MPAAHATTHAFVAPHHLESVHQAIGGELCRTLDFLRTLLVEIGANGHPSAREYAQLREAKALIKHVKYTGATTLARQDEIAWALQYVRDSYGTHIPGQGCLLLEKAAVMLGIDLSAPHAMPLDLAHRIENELALRSRARAA